MEKLKDFYHWWTHHIKGEYIQDNEFENIKNDYLTE